MKISIDTRTLQPGDIYIPIKGGRFDGHAFIDEAMRKGARKVLDVDIAKYAKKYRQKLSCKVIAVTGSAGKTTVKDLLYYMLSERFKVSRTEGNLNNEIGVPLSLLSADDDTDILILELAMRNKGEIAYLTRIARPTHVVITGIGLTHIANFKTQSEIARAKGEIFQSPLKWEDAPRNAYINYRSPYSEWLINRAGGKGYKVFPYDGETRQDQNLNVCYRLGREFGLTEAEIQRGLSRYQPSNHRLVITKHSDITLIDDTYNANPDGMTYALQYLSRFSGRKIAVLGDMLELGKFSKKAHEKIVDAAIEAGVDLLFTFGEETRTMKSNRIPISHFNTKSSLRSALKDEIQSGDVILIKGSRGMKMEEEVEWIKTHVFN